MSSTGVSLADETGTGDRKPLDADRAGHVEGAAIGGIDVTSDGDALARSDLHHEQQHRAGAQPHHRFEFLQMAGAACRHRIRKFGQARPALAMASFSARADLPRIPPARGRR